MAAKNRSKIGKNSIREKPIYALYDPKMRKYIKSISYTGYRYGSPKIYYSSNAKALLLSEHDISRLYKKAFEIKSRLRLADKEFADYPKAGHKYGPSKEELKKEIKDLKATLKLIDRFKLQQFRLVSSKDKDALTDFKIKGLSRLTKQMIRNSFINAYGWTIGEWFLREIKKTPANFPFAIITFDVNTYNLNVRDSMQEEISKKIKGLGVKLTWFSRYQCQLEIPSEEDYHLICLSFDKHEFRQKILISELIDLHSKMQLDIENYVSNKW